MRNCVKVLDLAWLALWITGVILRAWSMWTEEVGGFDGKGIRGAVPPPPGRAPLPWETRPWEGGGQVDS